MLRDYVGFGKTRYQINPLDVIGNIVNANKLLGVARWSATRGALDTSVTTQHRRVRFAHPAVGRGNQYGRSPGVGNGHILCQMRAWAASDAGVGGGVRTVAGAVVQPVQAVHVLGGEFEAEHVEVLGDALGRETNRG